MRSFSSTDNLLICKNITKFSGPESELFINLNHAAKAASEWDKKKKKIRKKQALFSSGQPVYHTRVYNYNQSEP
ncbi:hypothetical protein BBI00_10870 [Chryseobacterium arthrosphaerae]|uniref:Uncharacterized protein n=1 Tax=Chryseobacterium arthrosphaerae TaxID=651561 RepID=A0A1B8ZT99_9FLAO|nr:hypothetical protein BBI00_10870 [Chryseobacterium arthrosphaerae]